MLQCLHILAHIIVEPDDDRETPVAFKYNARLAPADRGADHVLHCGYAEAEARNRRFVNLDV